MLTDRELALRQRTLGSSEIGVIAGHSIYRNLTPITIWESKVFGHQRRESTAMNAGSYFERGIAEWYLDETGLRKDGWKARKMVRRVHPRNHWMSATCDFQLVRRKKSGLERAQLIECKYVGPGMEVHWDTDAEDGLPAYVQDQGRWQMSCANEGYVHVAAFFALPRVYRIYEMKRDTDIEGALITIGDEFWRRHVIPRDPPPLDQSEASARQLARMFPDYADLIVPAPAEADELAAAYHTAREDEKAAREKKEQLKLALCQLIGEHAGIEGHWGRAIWKNEKRGRVDGPALLEHLLTKMSAKKRKALEDEFRKPPIRGFRLSYKG